MGKARRKRTARAARARGRSAARSASMLRRTLVSRTRATILYDVAQADA